MTATERTDPYWAGMWDLSSSAVWESRELVERRREQGLRAPVEWLKRSREDCAYELAQGRHRSLRLSALAATNLFRTVTDQQLQAITGLPLFSERGTDQQLLLGSGLLQRGIVASEAALYRKSLPRVFRVNTLSNLTDIRQWLTDEEMPSLTSGQWKTTLAADRHNVLATEFLLRVAEYTDVPLVLGEGVCEARRISPPAAMVSPKSSKAADGMLVRDDGMRIVIEVTASTSANVKAKVEHWSNILTKDANRSMVVLWLVAPHPDRGQAVSIRPTISEAMKKNIDAVLNLVPERMLVANWKDWFPEAHTCTDDFLSLRCQRSTGTRGDEWESVDLLNPFAFPYLPYEEAENVLRESKRLMGVPHWMR